MGVQPMNPDNAAQIYATRQLEAVMAEVFKADDQRKKRRRLKDREGNGGKNHLCLLIILLSLISVLTSIAVTTTYILQVCAFRAH
jgi:hypothetical protein